MIQRIQTIYLLISIILSSLLFFFPFQSNILFSEIKDITLNWKNHANSYLQLASILNAFLILLTIMTIFLYKKRKIQMKLCYSISILQIILLLLMLHGANQEQGLPTYKLPFIIPIINTIIIQMARFYIKKDEELVRSADRLR
ncbi:MAG: DUF4293 domain-containing protein [Bacteroidia bacterium]|nr:DUF4293 domain-containing protein [Bacteroidia bacterium]